MKRSYYVVLVKWRNKWGIEFGDYNKDTARQEYNSLKRENGRTNVRFITSDYDSQEALDQIVAVINGESPANYKEL